MKRFLDLQKVMCLNGEETVFRIIRSEQDIAYYCTSELELLSVAMFETRRHFGSSAECSNYKDTKFKGEGWYKFSIAPIPTGWSCTHEFRCIYLGKEAPNDVKGVTKSTSTEEQLKFLTARCRQSGVKLFLDEVCDTERERELREKLDKARDMEKVKEITKEEIPDLLKEVATKCRQTGLHMLISNVGQDKEPQVKLIKERNSNEVRKSVCKDIDELIHKHLGTDFLDLHSILYTEDPSQPAIIPSKDSNKKAVVPGNLKKLLEDLGMSHEQIIFVTSEPKTEEEKLRECVAEMFGISPDKITIDSINGDKFADFNGDIIGIYPVTPKCPKKIR